LTHYCQAIRVGARRQNPNTSAALNKNTGLMEQTKRTPMKKNNRIIALAFLISALAAPAFADGKATFEQNCAKCHGNDGKGQTKMGAKLGAKDYTTVTVDAAKAFKSVKDGLTKGDQTLMKPFGDKLTDAEIKDAIAQLAGFKK
jgi:mono/diheme cytochrome c family protein